MNNNLWERYCRICWLDNIENGVRDELWFPTYFICDCCSVEFWYEDISMQSILDYRKYWLSNIDNWNKKTINNQLQIVEKIEKVSDYSKI